MLVFNQQANIKNVNGAIADNFANRPAPQSTFYIFYSIDTQEIYYDNGTWVLIGIGGGGTPVNIYNSDGTLTGNRIVNATGYDLSFLEMQTLKFSNYPLDYGYYQDLATIKLGDYAYNYLNGTYFQIDANNGVINTGFQNNNIGLKLDFANSVYQFGQLNGGNSTYLEVSENPLNEIAAYNNGGINGLYLSFVARSFSLGDFNNVNTDSFVSVNLKEIALVGGTNDRLTFKIDGQTNVAKTIFQNLDNGLILDFNNNYYVLGRISGGNNTSLFIDDQNLYASIGQGGVPGIELNFGNKNYKFGQTATGNATFLQIDDTNAIIKTSNQGNDIGLKLDFANGLFLFGETLGSGAFLEINNTTGSVTLQNSLGVTFLNNNGGGGATFLGDVNGNQNGTLLTIDYFANQIIKTSNQGNDIGLNLDFANTNYILGDYLGISGFYDYLLASSAVGVEINSNRNIFLGDVSPLGNSCDFNIDITNTIIKSRYNTTDIGLKLDFANTTYQFGQITGGNTTYLTIDDAATYSLQIDGTNVLSGTSGSTSGQHLKIKINGVDYKIELKNP